MATFVTIARIASGVVVWGLHFSVIYGITALACARGLATIVPWTIGIATVVAAALAFAIIAREWPRRTAFDAWLAAALAASALVGIVFEGLTMLVVPACT
jgi:hypothetical protein